MHNFYLKLKVMLKFFLRVSSVVIAGGRRYKGTKIKIKI